MPRTSCQRQHRIPTLTETVQGNAIDAISKPLQLSRRNPARVLSIVNTNASIPPPRPNLTIVQLEFDPLVGVIVSFEAGDTGTKGGRRQFAQIPLEYSIGSTAGTKEVFAIAGRSTTSTSIGTVFVEF